MLQSCLPYKPVMWNDLFSGADHNLSKSCVAQQPTSTLPTTFPGREGTSGKDGVRSEAFSMGSMDVGVLMADPYTEEDVEILATGCNFPAYDAEEAEEELPLFGYASEVVKPGYSWEPCFGNLEDVDDLLSSGPESCFGAAAGGGEKAENGVQVRHSESRSWSERGGAAEGVVDGALVGMSAEVVGGGGGGVAVRGEDEKGEAGRRRAECGEERWGGPASVARCIARQCVLDGEGMGADAVSSTMTGDGCVSMDTSGDGSPCVVRSELEKASIAQAQRARRHAASRKRMEERARRQVCQRKALQGTGRWGSFQAAQAHMLQAMPGPLIPQAARLSAPSLAAIHGYAAPRSKLSPMQSAMRPGPPFMQGGYGPVGAIRQFQAAAPAAQMQFVGYQPPSPFQPAMGVPHPEFRLRVPVDSRSRGSGGSSGNMTREEKVEKLRYLQGMQTGRVAVEQQHSGMESGGGVGQARGMSRQVEVGTASGSEMRAAGMEGGYSPSLSVGQTSLETTSEEENRAMEGAVLGRLQETLKSLQVETKLCIRDALYRLARSAMRRKGPGGWDGEGECESGLVSESGDGASDGVESSGNSDPCSSSRVSRMSMNTDETETNPMDRTVAHLLFHEGAQEEQAGGMGFGGAECSMADAQNSGAPLQGGSAGAGRWGTDAADGHGAMSAGAMQGVEMGGAASICVPMGMVTGGSPMARLEGESGMRGSAMVSGGGGGASIGVEGTGMSNSEVSYPMGTHCGNGGGAGEERTQKTIGGCGNGLCKKRLEHALGFREFGQFFSERWDNG